MTVEQLLDFLQERNQFLTVENERLRQHYELLQASVDQKEAMFAWQQRLICLGEEHVALLEKVLRGPSTETVSATESPPQFMEHQFRQQTCSSPLNTPPNLRLESNQDGDSTSFAAGVTDDNCRRGIIQDDLEVMQRCAESEALAYLASYC
jgi:hypothetical protein